MSSTLKASTSADGSRQYVGFSEYIDYQLKTARRGIHGADVLSGMVGAILWLAAYLFVFAVTDHWLVRGGWGAAARYVWWSGFLGGLGYWLWSRVYRPWSQRVTQLYAASQLEEVHPELKSNLLTLIDLQQAGRPVSQSILDSMERRAATNLQQINIDDAVDRRTLTHLSYALLGMVMVLCIYTIASPKSLISSAWRALFPMANVAPGTRTSILAVQPGDTTLLAHSKPDITADLSGSIPEEVKLVYSTLDRKIVDEVVRLQDTNEGIHRYRGRLLGEGGDGLMQNITYRIEAGDAVSPTYTITVRQPPTATVTEVQYDYPAYMGVDDRTQADSAIDAWEGTTVTVKAQTNVPVDSATIKFSDTEDTTIKGEELPMQVQDGVHLTFQWQLKFRPDGTFPRFYRIEPVRGMEHGVGLTLHTVRIRPDLPPKLEVLYPQGDIELPANSTLPVAYEASDPDFQLKSVIMRFEKDGEALPRQEILFDTPPLAPRTKGKFPLSLKTLGVQAGQKLVFWLEAKDNFEPFADRLVNLTRSPRITITVIDPVEPEAAAAQQQLQEQAADQQLDKVDPMQNPGDEGQPGEPMAEPNESRPDQPDQRAGQPPMPEQGDPSQGAQPDNAQPQKPGDQPQGESNANPGAEGQPQDNPGQSGNSGKSKGKNPPKQPSGQPQKNEGDTQSAESSAEGTDNPQQGQPQNGQPTQGQPRKGTNQPQTGQPQTEQNSEESQSGHSAAESNPGKNSQPPQGDSPSKSGPQKNAPGKSNTGTPPDRKEKASPDELIQRILGRKPEPDPKEPSGSEAANPTDSQEKQSSGAGKSPQEVYSPPSSRSNQPMSSDKSGDAGDTPADQPRPEQSPDNPGGKSGPDSGQTPKPNQGTQPQPQGNSPEAGPMKPESGQPDAETSAGPSPDSPLNPGPKNTSGPKSPMNPGPKPDAGTPNTSGDQPEKMQPSGAAEKQPEKTPGEASGAKPAAGQPDQGMPPAGKPDTSGGNESPMPGQDSGTDTPPDGQQNTRKPSSDQPSAKPAEQGTEGSGKSGSKPNQPDKSKSPSGDKPNTQPMPGDNPSSDNEPSSKPMPGENTSPSGQSGKTQQPDDQKPANPNQPMKGMGNSNETTPDNSAPSDSGSKPPGKGMPPQSGKPSDQSSSPQSGTDTSGDPANDAGNPPSSNPPNSSGQQPGQNQPGGKQPGKESRGKPGKSGQSQSQPGMGNDPQPGTEGMKSSPSQQTADTPGGENPGKSTPSGKPGKSDQPGSQEAQPSETTGDQPQPDSGSDAGGQGGGGEKPMPAENGTESEPMDNTGRTGELPGKSKNPGPSQKSGKPGEPGQSGQKPGQSGGQGGKGSQSGPSGGSPTQMGEAGNTPGEGGSSTGRPRQNRADQPAGAGESAPLNLPPEEIDLENRKKALDLRIKQLQDQLSRGDVPEDLKDANYSVEELDAFLKNLDQQIHNTDPTTPEAQARQRQFEELLKGVDQSHQGELKAGQTGEQGASQTTGGSRRPTPKRFQSQEEAFRKRMQKSP